MQLVPGSVLRGMPARCGELAGFQSRFSKSPLSLQPLLLLAEVPPALAEMTPLMMLQAGSKTLRVAVVLICERAILTLFRMPQMTLVSSNCAVVLALGECSR